MEVVENFGQSPSGRNKVLAHIEEDEDRETTLHTTTCAGARVVELD